MTDISAALAKIHAFRQRFDNFLKLLAEERSSASEYATALNVLKPITDSI